MNSIDYTVKAGDLQVPIEIDLSYSTGTPPDLSPPGTTAQFRLRPFQGVPVRDVAATLVDATTVRVVIDIPTTPTIYEGEVFVTWGSGRTRRFPADPTHPYLVFAVQAAIPSITPTVLSGTQGQPGA